MWPMHHSTSLVTLESALPTMFGSTVHLRSLRGPVCLGNTSSRPSMIPFADLRARELRHLVRPEFSVALNFRKFLKHLAAKAA